MNHASKLSVLAFGLVVSGVGCAEPVEESDESVALQAQAIVACTPAVIVIRHAEDTSKCVVGEVELDASGPKQRVHQRCLTVAGEQHAQLYAKDHRLANFVAGENLCPVGRVITQDPWTLVNGNWPSANPFETIRPFAVEERVPITFLPPKQIFDEKMRASLLADEQHSVVISWDKEGLVEQERPLLAEMNASPTPASFPSRDKVYVFKKNLAMAASAKFDLTEYTQFFQADYFASVVGESFSSSSYYRFNDGALTAPSTDVIASDMILCRGTCGGKGVSLPENLRR